MINPIESSFFENFNMLTPLSDAVRLQS